MAITSKGGRIQKCWVIILMMISLGLSAQNAKTEAKGLSRVYLGLGAGSDFNDFHGSINLRLVFKNAPVLYLDYMIRFLEPSNVPDNYHGDVTLFPQDPAKDLLKTWSIMGGKEYKVARNLHLMIVGGLNVTKLDGVRFTPVSSGTFQSNYSKSWEREDIGGGFTAKCGLNWQASKWCGFGLELAGNLNDLGNYAAINFGIHLGWIGKQK